MIPPLPPAQFAKITPLENLVIDSLWVFIEEGFSCEELYTIPVENNFPKIFVKNQKPQKFPSDSVMVYVNGNPAIKYFNQGVTVVCKP